MTRCVSIQDVGILGDSELDQVTAGTLQVGNGSAGAIDVSAAQRLLDTFTWMDASGPQVSGHTRATSKSRVKAQKGGG